MNARPSSCSSGAFNAWVAKRPPIAGGPGGCWGQGFRMSWGGTASRCPMMICQRVVSLYSLHQNFETQGACLLGVQGGEGGVAAQGGRCGVCLGGNGAYSKGPGGLLGPGGADVMGGGRSRVAQL